MGIFGDLHVALDAPLPPMAKEPHLLFVDDENLLHNLFERLFTRNGFQVTCCSGAMQAIDLMKEHDYDLVITDFMMPDMVDLSCWDTSGKTIRARASSWSPPMRTCSTQSA